MSVTNQQLVEVLEILFQGKQAFSATTFFTVSEIEELGTLLNLPLPDNLLQVLITGVRQGTFLRCTVAGTERTGSPEFEYGYNPDMLRVNYKNRQLLNQQCLYNHALKGTVTTAANNRAPCYGTRGSITGLYGLNSGSCNGSTNASLLPPINPTVLRNISRCCRR